MPAASFKLLLRVGRADCLRSAAYETSRRDLYRVALLIDLGGSCRSYEKRGTMSIENGSKGSDAWTSGEPARPQYLKSLSGTQRVSVSLAQYQDLRAATDVKYGYHLYPTAQH
jgi:hypothetical protein